MTDSDEVIEQYISLQWSLACLAGAEGVIFAASRHSSSGIRSMYTDERRGRFFTEQLTDPESHGQRIRNMTRMGIDTFMKLVNWLKRNTEMTDSERGGMEVREKVLIFLYITTQGVSYRNAAEMFHHSTDSISKVFHEVLEATRILGRHWIRTPTAEYGDISFKDDPKRWPFFKGCIGALDGSHIPMSIPSDQQSGWRNRKR